MSIPVPDSITTAMSPRAYKASKELHSLFPPFLSSNLFLKAVYLFFFFPFLPDRMPAGVSLVQRTLFKQCARDTISILYTTSTNKQVCDLARTTLDSTPGYPSFHHACEQCNLEPQYDTNASQPKSQPWTIMGAFWLGYVLASAWRTSNRLQA